MVTAGAAANTKEGDSLASWESRVGVFTFTDGL